MEKFSKQPFEEFVISGDFINVLDTAGPETISSPVVTAVDIEGTDVSDTVLDQNTVASDSVSKVSVLVRAGSNSVSPYKITFRCTTSTGNKWELDVAMHVKEN